MFLGTDCTPHGGAGSGIPNCCLNLTPWTYDAKTGTPYPGYMCWNAACVPEGMYAGPGGEGNYCCPPLVNVNGKCSKPAGNTETWDYATYKANYITRLAASSCANLQAINAALWTEINNLPYINDAQRNELSQLYYTAANNCGKNTTTGSTDYTTYLLYGGGALLLLMLLKGKKKHAGGGN